MSDWWSADPVVSGPPNQQMSGYGKAISSIESGGRYDLLGPVTRNGDRAYGKYQVMGANVPTWTKDALGQSLTPEQFLQSREAQDAVFAHRFGSYVSKYGPEGAARAWFAGEGGMNDNNRKDILGTSVADYARKFNAANSKQEWWANDPVAKPQTTFGERLADVWENPGGAITVKLAKDIANKMNILGDYSQGKISSDPESNIPGGLPVRVQDAAGSLAQIASPMAPGRLLASSVKTPSLSIPLPQARPQPIAAPTTEQLKESYRAGMASPEVRSVHGDASLANRVASDVRAGLEAKDVDEILAPKTLATIGKWEKNKAEGESVTIRDIEALRRRLGKLAGSSDGDERAAATIARRAVDDFYTTFQKSPGSTVVFGDLEKAVPIITNSRADYRSAKLAELLDAKKYRAELRSDAANSGMNMGNTLRQRMADVLTGPESRGLTPEIKSGLEGVVHGTTGTNTARIAGNILGGGGGIGATAVGIGGAVATGSPLVVLAPVIGNIIRRLGNHMTEKQVAALNEAARLNSPLARRLAGPSQDFEKAARAIEISVTPRNFAKLTLAARNLSNNLKDAGVLIPANDIMRSIQAPQKSAAEDQQPVPGRPGQ